MINKNFLSMARIRTMLMALLIATQSFIIRSESTANEITLNHVNLSRKSILFQILHEVVVEVMDKFKDGKVRYLTLDIDNDDDGFDVSVIAHERSRLIYFNGYTGYTLIDSLPVFITNNSKMKLNVERNAHQVFKMESALLPPYVYDPQEWNFYISGESYGRYVDEIGWIWSNTSVNKIKLNNKKMRLYAPKRFYNSFQR